MNQHNLLFWGDLPPEMINGVAISNQTNLAILSKKFNIDKVVGENTFHHHGKFSFFKFFSFIHCLLSILKKAAQKRYRYFYLVFSVSTFGAIKTLVAIAGFRLLNRGTVVIHIHRGDFFTRFYKGTINKILSRLIFRLCGKIIVLAEKQKQEFEMVFKPCEVLYNTVDLEYKAESQEKRNIHFVYISNYLVDKGIIDLLQVFTRLMESYPDITLKTYGAFSDPTLKQTILTYAGPRIQINGPISGIKKFRVLEQSDCLILPSWNEGQPIVLLEAMSVGTPVIATKVGLIPDLLGSGYPFMANAQDLQSLEACLISFIETQGPNELARQLKETYDSFYSQKKHEQSLLQIFH